MADPKQSFDFEDLSKRLGELNFPKIDWDELMTVDPDELTVRTVPDRLAEHGDPWADMDDHPQDIGQLVERFADDLANGIPDAPWPPVYPKMPNEAPRVQPSRARRDAD